ncbi:MAG: hypothetical protein HW382_103 [Deltaproteobacteria bacterium]|nr:hypothetical protein [Deltaproteobacteria bacterium]MBM2837544.1 hypothetical protein [Deltaproteobacteria bacterium]
MNNTILAAIFLSQFFLVTVNASAVEKCRPNTPYYFSEFKPASWKIGNELNYEEVYKNFEYFEVIFNKSCDEITIKRYKKGVFDSSEKYKVDSDGSIQKTGDRQ